MSIINVHQDLALAECKIVELRSEVEKIRAEVAALTKERDGAYARGWDANVSAACEIVARAEKAEAEVARLRAALDEENEDAERDRAYLVAACEKVAGHKAYCSASIADEAVAEAERLRAAAIPADAEERVAAKLLELERGDDPEGCEAWSEGEMVRWIARQLLAAIRRQA